MKMDHRMLNPAAEIEKFSKLGTQDLQNNHLERALESFKYAYKRSKELDDDSYTERACAFNLGAVYIALGDGKKGIEILNKALPPDNAREGRSNGDLFFNLGLGHEMTGNTEEAVRSYKKAFEEYKIERDNVQMEAETLEKLGQLYLKTRNKFTMETFDQLAQTYEILNNPSKQLWALTEKANQQFANALAEESEKTAEECLKLAEKCGPSVNLGTIYNDLGLIFTQRQKYDKAVSCFELALPMVEGPEGDEKQMAVLLQNLGATYNFLGNYQKAVEYHEKAGDMYARLRNRNSQGQCFANMAFAYSQLGDITNAGEAFLHALQAAKDSGDKRTQWQVSEGLGAVAFNQNNIKKAVEYFQKALTLVASSEPSNTVAQNRIVAKITLALQTQVQKESAPAVKENRTKNVVGRTPVREPLIKKEVATPVQASSTPVGSPRRHERFVPVGRKGSSLRYEKVARGLSKDTIITESIRSSTRNSMIDIESEEEESSGDSEEEEEEDNSDIDKTIHKTEMAETIQGRASRSNTGSVMNTNRRQSTKMAQIQGLHNDSSDSSSSDSSSESEEDTARNDEEDDEKAVKEALKKQLDSHESSDSDSDVSQKNTRDKTRPKQAKEESESSADEAPPLPTQSPPQTKLLGGTYETPERVQDRKLHYADIEHTGSPKSGGERFVRHSEHSSHPNFLSDQADSSSSSEESDDDDDSEDDHKKSSARKNEGLEASGTYHEIEIGSMQGAGTAGEDDPLYQSIPARPDTARTQDGEVDTPTFEKGPQFKNFSDLPRGMNVDSSAAESDVFHYEQHQKMARERQAKLDQENENKDSKTCSVM
ncbi:tetratricopeptide repeat protein 24-like isoform X2 [Saccostrea echinata]|uniref:tetratricopeptide repeat protein 24-like isoform X2 n=1 Tax=Saccostrea echinata TaxID=191078 RepID=UPI002A81A2EE|nr:tetratricopeptide repeat protein 24-like isoform X2 [Saccostrea echinata]